MYFVLMWTYYYYYIIFILDMETNSLWVLAFLRLPSRGPGALLGASVIPTPALASKSCPPLQPFPGLCWFIIQNAHHYQPFAHQKKKSRNTSIVPHGVTTILFTSTAPRNQGHLGLFFFPCESFKNPILWKWRANSLFWMRIRKLGWHTP